MATQELMERDPVYFEWYPEMLDQLYEVYLRALIDRTYLVSVGKQVDHVIGAYRTLYGPQGGLPFNSPTYRRLEQASQRLHDELDFLVEVIRNLELFPPMLWGGPVAALPFG